MATKTVSILQAGTNSHTESAENVGAIATDFISQGVVGTITSTSGVAPLAGAYAANAQGTPNMTVAITSGVAWVTGTPTGGNSQTFRVKMTSSENVTIAANSTGGTRYDYIYIKLDAAKLANPNLAADDVATLLVSRSTSTTTDDGTPPTYGYLIAKVTVSNGASSIVNANITDMRTQASFNAVVNDGWTPVSDSWTYASATTITVPAGATSKYSVGDKLKLTQSGSVAYFYITTVASTLLTINGGTDYTLTNTAISGIYYSKADNPLNFPGYFNYVPTWGSTGTAPAIGNGTLAGTFRLSGKVVTFDLIWQAGSSTTFGTNSYTFTFPVTASSYYISGTGPTNRSFNASGYMEDNGVAGYIATCGLTNSTIGATKFTVRYQNTTTSGAVGATAPWSMGNTDYLQLAGTYRID